MKRLLLALPLAFAACDGSVTAPSKSLAPAGHPSFAISPTGTCTFTVTGTTNSLVDDCTTSTSIIIPDGETLDGAFHTITAEDPSGGHFLGAVVTNGGAVANVTNVTITASGLADVCDGTDPIDNRLRGILLNGASGSITNNTVTGVRQGQSGCQEGNAIEVRNDNTGSDLLVLITGNTVSDYQKNGITARGSVAATITNNIVVGDGPIDYIAQNGIQVSFGATAVVEDNTVGGNDYTPASFVACGVLLFQADGVRISRNKLFDNERNMCNFGKGGGKFNPTP